MTGTSMKDGKTAAEQLQILFYRPCKGIGKSYARLGARFLLLREHTDQMVNLPIRLYPVFEKF